MARFSTLAAFDYGGADVDAALRAIDEMVVDGSPRAFAVAISLVVLHPNAPDRLIRHRVADAALRAVMTMVASDLAELPTYDRAARSWSAWGAGWDRAPTADAERARLVTLDRTALDRVLSMHGSGHVRGDAVAHLDEASLAWLLVRTTDWVDPVRRLAIERARAAVERASVAQLVEVTRLARRLRGASRSDAAVLDRIGQRLAADASEALRLGRTSADARLRGEVLRTTAAFGTVPRELAHAFLRDVAPNVRCVAAEVLARDGAADVETAMRLSQDAAGRLRAMGARMLGALGVGRDRLEALLLDRVRAVRWEVLTALGDRAPDVRRLALDALAERVTVGAVRALEDHGKPEDWEALFPALDAGTDAAVAAVYAMNRLARASSRETRLMMAGDRRLAVSRAAVRTLEGDVWQTDRPIADGYAADPEAHVRAAGAVLLRQLGARRWR